MNTLYCPKCEANVLAEREEIEWCLVIILAIFTAGLGLLIYFAIYFNKPQNRCVHCNSICEVQAGKPEQAQHQPLQNPYHITTQSQEIRADEEEIQEKVSFCPNCGVKLERAGGKYCPFCGSSTE